MKKLGIYILTALFVARIVFAQAGSERNHQHKQWNLEAVTLGGFQKGASVEAVMGELRGYNPHYVCEAALFRSRVYIKYFKVDDVWAIAIPFVGMPLAEIVDLKSPNGFRRGIDVNLRTLLSEPVKFKHGSRFTESGAIDSRGVFEVIFPSLLAEESRLLREFEAHKVIRERGPAIKKK